MKFLISALLLVAALQCFANEEKEEGFQPFVDNTPVKSLAKTPEAPKLTSPEFFSSISGGEVTLKWSKSEGANFYHVQVATDPNFKWLVANEPLFQGNEYKVSGLQAGKHYFWRVAAGNTENDKGYLKGYFQSSMFETK